MLRFGSNIHTFFHHRCFFAFFLGDFILVVWPLVSTQGKSFCQQGIFFFSFVSTAGVSGTGTLLIKRESSKFVLTRSGLHQQVYLFNRIESCFKFKFSCTRLSLKLTKIQFKLCLKTSFYSKPRLNFILMHQNFKLKFKV